MKYLGLYSAHSTAMDRTIRRCLKYRKVLKFRFYIYYCQDNYVFVVVSNVAFTVVLQLLKMFTAFQINISCKYKKV